MCAEFDRMAEACIDTAFVVMEHGTPGMRSAMRMVLAELSLAERERTPRQFRAERRRYQWGYHALRTGPDRERMIPCTNSVHSDGGYGWADDGSGYCGAEGA